MRIHQNRGDMPTKFFKKCNAHLRKPGLHALSTFAVVTCAVYSSRGYMRCLLNPWLHALAAGPRRHAAGLGPRVPCAAYLLAATCSVHFLVVTCACSKKTATCRWVGTFSYMRWLLAGFAALGSMSQGSAKRMSHDPHVEWSFACPSAPRRSFSSE